MATIFVAKWEKEIDLSIAKKMIGKTEKHKKDFAATDVEAVQGNIPEVLAPVNKIEL